MRWWLLLSLLCFSCLAHADITLGDLGVDQEAAKPTIELSHEDLQVRHSSLKTHEVLGLTTLAAMTLTAFTGNSAMDSDLHMYLGLATAGLYGATAYYSLSAPKPANMKDKGRVKWHKALAWVHAPLMIITPYLGYMYRKHEKDGKDPSSLEKQHTSFAGALLGTFAVAATLMVVEF